MGRRACPASRFCYARSNDAELRAVLAHEFAHVHRRDVLWSGLLPAVAAALWIQPLNRVALVRVSEAAEHACDDCASVQAHQASAILIEEQRELHLTETLSGVAGRSTEGLELELSMRRVIVTRRAPP